MNLTTPLVNGNRFDYSCVTISVDGRVILGQDITSITYKHQLKPEKIYGTSPYALGRTRGRYEADGTLEVTKEAFGELVDYLSVDPNKGYMEQSFTVTVAYQADPGGQLVTDKLIGCRITEDEDNHKQGAEGLTVRCTLDIMSIERDDITPLISASLTLTAAIF